MDTAATELECFQVLKKQEQLAASHRISNLWAEVEKQKELEKTLQKKYGDLLAELERIQNVMNQYRAQAQQQEEIAAKNQALEVAETASDEADVHGMENAKDVPQSDDQGSAVLVNSTHDETTDQQVDIVSDKATSSPKNDMDVDAEQTTHEADVKLQIAAETAAEWDSAVSVPGNSTDSNTVDRETTLDTSAAEEIRSSEECGKCQDSKNSDNVVEAVNSHDNIIEESTALDDSDKKQVAEA